MNPKHAEGVNQVGLVYITSWASLMEDSLIFTEWLKRKQHNAKYLYSES
jgi:hypothetical protein